jgi:hypothetical protein
MSYSKRHEARQRDDEGARTDVGRALHFGFDEAQEVLLVHAARVMDVRVDLADIVKIAVPDSSGWDSLFI